MYKDNTYRGQVMAKNIIKEIINYAKTKGYKKNDNVGKIEIYLKNKKIGIVNIYVKKNS